MTLTKLLRAAFATKPRPKARRRLRLEALEGRWCPAGGQLDTTFNGTGSKTLPGTMYNASESVVQPDGKIVTVGSSANNVNRAKVVRMNADGSLDRTFNGTGELMLPAKVGVASIIGCASAVLQPDGKILVGLLAGKDSSTFFTTKFDTYFAVARLNSNGSLDTSFGNNAGYWFFNPQVGNSSTETMSKLALLPDGGILVGGGAKAGDGYQGYAVVKLTASGQTSTTFGSGGMKVVHVGTTANSTAGSTMGLTATPSGGAVVAGAGVVPGGTMNYGCLVALTSSGQLDTGFNGTGTLFGQFGSRYYSVDMQGDRIVVGGFRKAAVGLQGLVAGYTLSGTLDTTFGAGGYYYNSTNPAISTGAGHLKVASDGSIAVGYSASYTDLGGVSHIGFQIVHLLADGSADTAYGSDGNGTVSVFDTVRGGGGTSLAIGPDNTVVYTRWGGTSSVYPVFTRFTGW